MDLKESEARLAELAPQIARILGWEQVDRDDRHLAELVAPEGYHVYLNAGWQGGYGKISISPGWPRDSRGQHVMSSYNAKAPRINVSATRDAKAFAQEISRRIVPEWLPMWQEALARIESSEGHERTTKSNAVRLAEIVGVDPSEVDRSGNFSFYRSTVFPENLSDVKVSGESVTLEIHCDVEDAEEILKALVKLQDRR